MKIFPSWKEKKRYLLIETKNQQKTKKEIIKNLTKLLGIINLSRARPIFIDNKLFNGYLVLSINRKYLSFARASLVLCKDAKCIYVSATLKKLKKFLKKK
ncbi:MAG: hypothetical protein QXO12_00065 [Candidatus Pacearchaeota archaeon]